MTERELPPGWVETELGELSAPEPNAMTDGPFGSKLKTAYYTESGVRVVRLGNIGVGAFKYDDEAFIDDERFAELRKHEVFPGDLLIAALAEPVGRCCPVPADLGPGIVKADCIRFKPNPSIESRYLMNWLNSPAGRKAVEELSHGIGRLRVNMGDLRRTPVRLAPLAEQRRIVEKIEALTARSRRAKEALAVLPALLDRYRQSVLAAAFRGDLTADWRAAQLLSDPDPGERDAPPLEFLPPLPSGWKWASVGDVGAVSGGLTKNAKRSTMPIRRPYLRVANVYADELRLDDVQEIGVSEGEEQRTLLRAHDLLVVEGNGSIDQIGRVALWRGEIEGCIHQNHIIKVRMPDAVSAEIALFWLLSALGRRCIEEVASSSAGLHTLSLSKVRALPVPVIPPEEANILVREVRATLDRLPAVTSVMEAASDRLATLDQSILAKAFRGELVPQDPADEPASVLLDRIRAERAAAGVAPVRRGRGRRSGAA